MIEKTIDDLSKELGENSFVLVCKIVNEHQRFQLKWSKPMKISDVIAVLEQAKFNLLKANSKSQTAVEDFG